MHAVLLKEKDLAVNTWSKRPIVIVGTGPVGVHVTQELLRYEIGSEIVQFGAEEWAPYNRVQLSSLLAGEINAPDIQNEITIPDKCSLVQHHHCEIKSIDRENSVVTDRYGVSHPYSKLVLAIGSSPHIPHIDGIDRPNIFTFRNMSDAQRLLARRVRSRRTVVLGGGLLGLEAARAMQKNNTEVLIVEHNSRLMQRQLDEQGADLLREYLFQLGINVYLKGSVKKISSRDSQLQIELSNGKKIECDTIVVATGIKPNIDLALNAGLHVGRGIKVNDCMQTCDPDIYAIGECAEFEGNVYGLVAPGFEQSSIAAHHISGGDSRYKGSISTTQLKVINRSVFSTGIVADDIDHAFHRKITYENSGEGVYRCLTLKRNTVVGAVAVGDWAEVNLLQENIVNKRKLYPWQLYRFKKTGLLWPVQKQNDIRAWPARATVCNCKSVTQGEITKLCEQQNCTVEDIARCTGASTVCGSCRPLIEQFVRDENASVEVDKKLQKTKLPVLVISIIALILSGLFITLEPIPVAKSVQSFSIDFLWDDPFWKQVTGYSLLGVSLVGLLMSLRKRFSWFTLGAFDNWRLFHIVLGVLLLFTLSMHTGLQLGANLNFMLMLTYLGIAVTGSFAALMVVFEARMSPFTAKRARSVANNIHLLLFWPFPVLVGFHIVSFYYF